MLIVFFDNLLPDNDYGYDSVEFSDVDQYDSSEELVKEEKLLLENNLPHIKFDSTESFESFSDLREKYDQNREIIRSEWMKKYFISPSIYFVPMVFLSDGYLKIRLSDSSLRVIGLN